MWVSWCCMCWSRRSAVQDLGPQRQADRDRRRGFGQCGDRALPAARRRHPAEDQAGDRRPGGRGADVLATKSTPWCCGAAPERGCRGADAHRYRCSPLNRPTTTRAAVLRLDQAQQYSERTSCRPCRCRRCGWCAPRCRTNSPTALQRRPPRRWRRAQDPPEHRRLTVPLHRRPGRACRSARPKVSPGSRPQPARPTRSSVAFLRRTGDTSAENTLSASDSLDPIT